MTLSAYLGLLSLGSTIETRLEAECRQEEQQELESLLQMAQQIAAAERDTVSTVSTFNAPSERKVEVRENITGVGLAIGTMVANYSLCFPIVAARHRLQALSTPYSYKRDTPLYGFHTILQSYRNGRNIRRLYPGFGLGLIGQTLGATYEAGLDQVMSGMTAKANQSNRWVWITLVKILSKGLALAINIPLYPLYRNALILRVQSDSDLTRIVIRTPYDFIQRYKGDLKDFLPTQHGWHGHIVSAFLPSCILNMITEKLLISIYRYIFQSFSSFTSSIASSSSQEGSSSSSSNTKKRQDATVLHTFYPEIACGVISSIITRAISYPIDTVIFKLMIQDTGVLRLNTNYDGFFDCIQTYAQENCWQAFYPGWGIGVLEIGMGYLILEASWWAYRLTQWKLQVPGSSDTRAVRKARKLRDRLST